MNPKKTKSKSKRTNKISQKRLVKIFIFIFLFTSLASISSYFLMSNKKDNTLEKTDNILETKNETKKIKLLMN